MGKQLFIGFEEEEEEVVVAVVRGSFCLLAICNSPAGEVLLFEIIVLAMLLVFEEFSFGAS